MRRKNFTTVCFSRSGDKSRYTLVMPTYQIANGSELHPLCVAGIFFNGHKVGDCLCCSMRFLANMVPISLLPVIKSIWHLSMFALTGWDQKCVACTTIAVYAVRGGPLHRAISNYFTIKANARSRFINVAWKTTTWCSVIWAHAKNEVRSLI